MSAPQLALESLIPVGTIESEGERWNEWHPGCLAGRQWLDSSSKEGWFPIEKIDYLVTNVYIRAQFRSIRTSTDREILTVRIYCVPEDLPGFRSKVVAAQPNIRKGSKLVQGRAVLLSLLELVSVNEEAWLGRSDAAHDPLLKDFRAPCSLVDIWDELPSPKVDDSILKGASPDTLEILSEALERDAPSGMTCKLFRYQKRSLWKLLSRELLPQLVYDPCNELFLGIGGREFWINVEGELRIEPDRYRDARGGIIAETMGVGKTVIMLALIMSTRGRLAVVEAPPHSIEPLIVATSLASESRQRVLSLVDILVNQIATSPSINLSADVSGILAPHVAKKLSRAVPFYTVKPQHSFSPRAAPKGSRRIRVTGSTLCVVPDNLVEQWSNEIDRHCPDLNFLIVRASVPDVEELAGNDLVLLGVNAFSRSEGSDLFFLHWKRLIIDEGHSLANKSLLTSLASRIFATSRWAVTGTPTRNLFALETSCPNPDQSKSPSPTDADDMSRLAKIFSTFLKCLPFHNDEPLWNRQIARPFLSQGIGAKKIKSLLSRMIIRHEWKDVIEEACLPPLERRTVELQFDDIGRMTYNALLALMTFNSIASEDVEQDSLFHQSQRSSLFQAVSNLRMSHFWLANPSLIKEVRDAIKLVGEDMRLGKRKNGVPYSARDMETLKEVERHFVPYDAFCKTLSHDAFGISGLSGQLARSWTESSLLRGEATSSLIWGERIISVRQALNEIAEEVDFGKRLDDDDLTEELTTKGYQRGRYDFSATKERYDVNQTELLKRKPKRRLDDRVKGSLGDIRIPLDSDLRRASVTSSHSSKLNYVLEQVRSNPKDKFIVMGRTPNAIYWMAEALDVLLISYRLYVHQGIDAQKRAQYADTFENDPECRVLIMDVKLGGRGLSLTAANRIIFLDPIWQPDLQAQAEKRCHRLGQTRPVLVETLAIQGTFEHAMLKRSSQLGRHDLRAVAIPQDDVQLRTLLRSAAFLEASPEVAALWSEPVPLLPDLRHVREPSPMGVETSPSTSPSTAHTSPPTSFPTSPFQSSLVKRRISFGLDRPVMPPRKLRRISFTTSPFRSSLVERRKSFDSDVPPDAPRKLRRISFAHWIEE